MISILKHNLKHVLVLIGFVIVAVAYFNPVLSGKTIFQNDIVHYIGMSKQQIDFREATQTETYWTNSAFGGMPTYQLGAKYPHNYIKELDYKLRFLPRPADYLFLYFLGFYILLLTLKVDFKLAAIGALAFGFSTYLIIILGVGHNSKAHAIAYMPLVLSGILLTFQKRYVLGFLATTVAMALELVANHFQMTYYLLLLVIILGIVYLIDAVKKQMLSHYFKAIAVLCVAVLLAIGLNATNILATQEYSKVSTRGQSELTIHPDGSPKETTTGLDKDYITQYSYGKLEALNLFIPRLFGGGNGENVGIDSELYEFYLRNNVPPIQAAKIVENMPTYWGEQPIVEAPAYIGAVILFLFVFALFLVKGPLKWWLVGGSILSLLLSFGHNLNFLTNFFIDYVPLYNKFRSVSSIQVILELCIPVLAVFALVRLFNDFQNKDEKLNALKYTVIITTGIAILLLLCKGFFDFSGVNDAYFKQAYGQQFIDALRDDRKAMFTNDTLRTLLLVVLSSGLIFGYLKEKISENLIIIGFGALILFDLVSVDRQYVNNNNFVNAISMEKPFTASDVDNHILKDTTYYRVNDLVSGGAKASYFYNALGGYHAAKLKRFNELNTFHIEKNNRHVLNMLNTKYIITQDEEGNPFPYINTQANGAAWFVKKLELATNANQEIKALDSLNTKDKAVYSKSKYATFKELPKNYLLDSLASIKLIKQQPNYLKYKSNNTNNGFAVFSEVYYYKGWQAFINGKAVDHYQVNYVLRGLPVPKGNHTIEFKFDPQVVKTGSSIALGSSMLTLLILIGGIVFSLKQRKHTTVE